MFATKCLIFLFFASAIPEPSSGMSDKARKLFGEPEVKNLR